MGVTILSVRPVRPARGVSFTPAQGKPVALALNTPGLQGPLGPVGPQGAAGTNTGFGQITYTDRTIGDEDRFLPGQRATIRFVANPGLTQDFLNAPFQGHVFWANNKLIARSYGDLLDVQVNLIVTADIAGGELRVDADVGSTLGPVASDTQVLFNGAGVPERVTFRLRIQTLSGFLLNGCSIYLTSNVPLTVLSETMLIAPSSIYTGAASLPLAGTLAARGVLAGNLLLGVPLASDLYATGVLNGQLALDVSFLGNILGRGVLAGAPIIVPPVYFTGALRGAGYVTGALSLDQNVALAGALFTAGRATGTLTQDIPLTGSLLGRGVATGSLTVDQGVALTGAMTGRGLMTGVLSQDVALAGAMVGRGLMTGSIGQGVALQGDMIGRGVITGTMTQDVALSGAMIGRGLMAGAITQDVNFTGAMVGRGLMTGSLTQNVNLTGAMIGRGLMAGTLTQDVNFTGAMVGRGLMAGTLTVAAGAATFTDSFNRADENLGANANWTQVDGSATAMGVRSNQLAALATTESTFLSPNLGSANHYVEATLALVGTNSAFMLLRATDLNNWLGVRNNASTYQVFKRVAGTLTQIGSSNVTPAVGDRIRLEVSGDSANLYINTSLQGSGTAMPLNGDLATSTRQGVIARTATRNPWIDDYKAGNL